MEPLKTPWEGNRDESSPLRRLRLENGQEREDGFRLAEVEVPVVRASRTLKYDTTAARFEEFLSWLLSKDTQSSMPGGGRGFRKRTAEFWRVWPMPAQTGELHRVVYVDGIYLARDLVVLIASTDEHVLSWYMAKSETSRAWAALLEPIPAPDVVVTDGGTGFGLATLSWTVS